MAKLKVEMVPRQDCETCKFGMRDAKREPCRTCLRASANREAPYTLWKPKPAPKSKLQKDMQTLAELEPTLKPVKYESPADIPLGSAVSAILDLQAEREALRGALRMVQRESERLHLEDVLGITLARVNAALDWKRG